MHRILIFVVFGACCLFLGFAAGCWLFSHDGSGHVGDMVTMAWGDGKYGESFYGAQVWVEPVGSRFTVRARVHIGHGNSLYQDSGVLSTEDTFPEGRLAAGRPAHRELLPAEGPNGSAPLKPPPRKPPG